MKPSYGSDMCDICETAFDDDFQLRQVSPLPSRPILPVTDGVQHKGVHHMWSLFCDPCSISFDHTAQAMEVSLCFHIS